MKYIKKLFGEVNMTWPKVIIFAVVTAIYTALINQVPFLKDTSFRDIAISFECWILFAIIIIVNSKSGLDSALKTFVFFLISQPLIYLIEVPFLGLNILSYYKNWIIWTILTLPMGFVGYYIKKDKWWGLLILLPMLAFVGGHYYMFLNNTMFGFPHHLLSTIFCVVTMYIYVLFIFKNKKIKIAGIIINTLIIIAMTILVFFNRTVYNTTVFVSGGEAGITFDDSYKFYLKDDKYGDLHVTYNENIQDYVVNAEFKKTGKTEIIVETPEGDKKEFEIDIKRDKFDINEKK